MNILYLSGTKDKKVNEQIVSVLKSLKHTVTDGSFSEKMQDSSSHLAKITKEIKRTDALIVEASETNFNLGRLMTLAIFQHKPILVLQQKGNKENVELGNNRLVNTKTYILDKPETIEKKLKDFTKTVEKQRLTYRFNLMLSRDINSYVMQNANERGISKADYIRSLIISDMEE